MAPSIEAFKSKSPLLARIIAVNLSAPESLDLERFDERIKSVDPAIVTSFSWLIRGDMWLLFQNHYHTNINKTLSDEGNTDPLNAAGHLTVAFLEDPGRRRRRISGWSISLDQEGILDKHRSEEYTRDILVPRLGSGFTYSKSYFGA